MRITRFCCCCSILVLSFLAAACILGGVCVPAVHAQGIITGNIIGDVVDQSGAVIPNAAVMVKNEATGAVMQAKSDAQGSFRIPDVPIGSYSVTVNASGFGATTLSHVTVVAGNSTPLGKVALSLGKTAETVEVEGSASEMINTESSQGEIAIDTEQLSTVPVAGAIDNVTLMVPGVVDTHASSFSNTNGANFSANGHSGRSNNSEIDGQTNNDDSIGGPSFFFSNQDAVQEVEVITTDMSAQYGRNFGSVVNYITKQGTNSFHGSGFETYLGSWGSSLVQYQKDEQFGFCPAGTTATEANNEGCSLVSVPRFVENRYGGTLGGPVIKNKLWLFGSTFWVHEYQSSSPDTSAGNLFPDANGLKQLQSTFGTNPAVTAMSQDGPYSVSEGNPQAILNATVNTPACTGISGALNSNGSCSVPVTDGTSTANIEMAGVTRSLPEHVLDQEELGRLDYQMTPKDRIYVRYAYQNNPWYPAWYLYFNSGLAGGGGSIVTGVTYETGADWTHTFTPNITNQLRYAFQQAKIGFTQGSIPSCGFTNFSSCTSVVDIGSNSEGFGYGYNSLLGGASLPQGRMVRVDQVQDNAQWTHGRHTILFGGEYDFQNSPWGDLPNIMGSYNFTPGTAVSSTYPGGIPLNTAPCGAADCNNGFSGMLQGIGTLSVAQGNPTIAFREPDQAYYFQDNWKLLPSLTLDLGLRYEYFGQSVNQIHSQSVARQQGPNHFWNQSLPLSATTFPQVNADYRNVEPRIGLAYTPSFLPKAVVHAGYAINVDPVFYNIFIDIATTSPVVNEGTVNCNPIAANGPVALCEPAGGWTTTTVQALTNANKLLPTGGDPRTNPIDTVPSSLRNPMAETYTLGIQYQVAPSAVAEVRYVGVHSFDDFQSINANPDILDVQSAFSSYGAGTSICTTAGATGYTRPNCNYAEVDSVGNTAFSIYNALQTSLTVRNFHGWTGTASYTFSRDIDNASDFAGNSSGGTVSAYAQNPLNTDVAERGLNANSEPNVWGIQLTYNEPWFSNQKGILGRLLGGYFLNSFYQYNSGQPMNPIQNAFTVQSGTVQADIAGTGSISAGTAAMINVNEATSSFCDHGFANAFAASCRPVLSNPKAPLQSIGINLGPGGYVDYVSGNPVSASSEHWLWNNQYEALALHNPFPGAGRNILRGDSWNDWDASLGKNIKTTERVNIELTMSVFNVLNRAYYGTPDPNVEDSSFGGYLSSFYAYNTSPGTAAGGGAYYAGFGNRNIEIGAHVTF
jgi:Carboxypeptidase regulatory-like domain